LQHLQDNDIRKIPSERKKGLTGAIIIHTILLLILVFIGFTIPPPPEFEEGILVNFGTDETGFGLIEPAPLVSTSYTPPPAPRTASSIEEPLLTQDTEEAPEVRRVDPDAERRRLEQAEANRIRQEQAREAERIRREQEELERQRLAEQQRQSDITNRTRDALAGSRNAGANSTSEGVAGGAGNQGVLTGSLNSSVRGDGSGAGNSGISYSLEGRGSVGLPLPRYDCQVAGRVVVEIRVDRDGRVTQANPGIRGSTELNECLVNAARDAAMAARFTPKPDAPAVQVGTITYNFVLR
jgi:TonB family protein